ncbi:MAG: hypothetical protein U0L92_03960 [Clostridia bacterium]|nr:hypothetical protein [Clostridia bacterium]
MCTEEILPIADTQKPDPVAKLKELLHCGNERVELSAAKELLALEEEAEKEDAKEQTMKFTVEIRIIDREDEGDG